MLAKLRHAATPVQHFVGGGKWDDEAVTAELRQHVREEIGDPDGICIVDVSGFAEKKKESCGVAPPVEKIENCQNGAFSEVFQRLGVHQASVDRSDHGIEAFYTRRAVK